MKLRILAAGALALVLFASPALAQTTIDLAPTINTVVLPALGILFVGVLTWAAKKYLGIELTKQDQATANDLFQKALAYGTAKVGPLPLKVDVDSPVIATALIYALEHGPEALKRLGITPQQAAEKLVARYMDPTVPVGVTELPVEPQPAPTPGA